MGRRCVLIVQASGGRQKSIDAFQNLDQKPHIFCRVISLIRNCGGEIKNY